MIRFAFQKGHFGHAVEARLEGGKLETGRPVRRRFELSRQEVLRAWIR